VADGDPSGEPRLLPSSCRFYDRSPISFSTQRITEVMVNGSGRVFVERRPARNRRQRHRTEQNLKIAVRNWRVRSARHFRRTAAARLASPRRLPRRRRAAADQSRQYDVDDSQILESAFHRGRTRADRHLDCGGHPDRATGDRRTREHSHQRRHRNGGRRYCSMPWRPFYRPTIGWS
jgi:hypothetical protein